MDADPTLDSALAARLIAAERDCFSAWVGLLAAQPGDPFGAEVRAFGPLTAIAAARVGHVIFSRVFEMTDADRDQLDPILDFYAARGASPLFDLSPYAVASMPPEGGLLDALGTRGFRQRGFHQMMVGIPSENLPLIPDSIAIRPVETDAEVNALAHIYGQIRGAGDADAIRPLVGAPEFHCLLAYVDDQPVGLGVAHVRNGATSMANGMTLPAYRGRGVQTALLAARVRLALDAGCDLLVSQCQAGSPSQRNQQRVGLRVAGTKVWWVRPPS